LTAPGAAGPRFFIPPEVVRFVTPKDNPSTPEKIESGRSPFMDKWPPEDSTVSCSTCPDPEKGFTGRLPTSEGIRDIG